MSPAGADYDFIVVGAGSAGAAVAARLSEDRGTSVLLLEAGRRGRSSFRAHAHRVPARGERSRRTCGRSNPSPSRGSSSGACPPGAARTLGGCSSINAMINVRGNPLDFDSWRARGLEGWDYASVLPYFRRLESSWRGENQFHGASGPVGNVPVDYPESLFLQLQQAALNMGLPLCNDHHAESQEGLSRIELTVSGGRRASTARAYLRARAGPGRISPCSRGAQVTRVTLEGLRATGVEYLRDGTLEQVRAAREVVLCGGAYNSPQVLQLSGIGPAAASRVGGREGAAPPAGRGRESDRASEPAQHLSSCAASSDSRSFCASTARRWPCCSGICSAAGRSRRPGRSAT